jgi:tellurite resistance protein tehB
MTQIPENFYRYKQTDIWTNETIPEAILNKHNTKAGVYGKILVLEGALAYTAFKDTKGEVDYKAVIKAGSHGVSAPQQWHKVEPIGETKFLVEFYQEKPENIQKIEEDFAKEFPDKKPHDELKLLLSQENFEGKKALDLGSGGGRNSLLMAKNGLSVTSWDQNVEGLTETQFLANRANLNLQTEEKNLNFDRVTENFDVIIATVSLQFLEEKSAHELWQSVVDHTNIGGYNLLIVPILSDDVGCEIPFPNLVPYENYLNFYENENWEILHADNMVGHFHRRDANGNRIKSRFATIIAKKIK